MLGHTKLAKALTVIVIGFCFIWLVYGVAYAVNRVVGTDIRVGQGMDKTAVNGADSLWLKLSESVFYYDGTDSVQLRLGFGLKVLAGGVDPDSLGCDETELDDYFVTLGTVQQITAVKGFSDTVRCGVDGSDGILTIYSEQGGTDYITVFKPSTMTQDAVYTLPPDDGSPSQFLQTNGSGVLTWETPAGTGDITAVGDVTSGDAFVATAGDDGATTLYFEGSTGDANEVALTTADPGSDVTVTIPATTGNLWVDAQTDIIEETHLKAVNASEDEDILTRETTTGDFEWHTPAELGLATTYDDFWGGSDLAIRDGTGLNNEIAIYYPVANDSNSYFVRHVHEGSTEDQVDTVIFSGKVPMWFDANGVDSITYNMRTSETEDDSCGITVKVWKRDGDELAALELVDSVAVDQSSPEGAWEHFTTGAMSYGDQEVAAGDVIEIWFIIYVDTHELCEHDRPAVWGTRR